MEWGCSGRRECKFFIADEMLLGTGVWGADGSGALHGVLGAVGRGLKVWTELVLWGFATVGIRHLNLVER
jgi:hypothetical protein